VPSPLIQPLSVFLDVHPFYMFDHVIDFSVLDNVVIDKVVILTIALKLITVRTYSSSFAVKIKTKKN